MRPAHGRDTSGAGHEGLFDECVDGGRKPAISPCGFHVRSDDAEALRDRDDDLAFRDIGSLREERSRDGVIKGAGWVVALLNAHEFGRLEREARVDVTLRRVD